VSETSLSHLLGDWKQGKFLPAYYFYGAEAADKKEAVHALKEKLAPGDFNFDEFQLDGSGVAEPVVAQALTLPVFSPRRLVVARAAKISAADRAVFAAYLENPCETTTLVLVTEEKKPDATDPVSSAISDLGGLCGFAPLTDDQALKRLAQEASRAGLKLNEEAAALLINEIGVDWTTLSQELEKLVLYCEGKSEISRQAVLECLGFRKGADPFGLGRLIEARDGVRALRHLKKMFEDGKSSEVSFRALSQISSVVLRQWKAERLLRGGMPEPVAAKSLRLHPYWDRDYFAGLRKLSRRKLSKDLRLCVETETALKSQSWLDARIELERLTAGLCKARG